MARSALVVVPAYNEAETIVEVVSRATRHADVCVVDDASTDDTAALVAGIDRVHCIRHARNTHIARGILDGFAHAREAGYEHCITMDAGLSHDPDAIPDFLARPDADLVLGYREAHDNVPGYRRALSAAASVMMNMAMARRPLPFGGPGLRDCTSGYRMYSRRAFELLLGADLHSRAFDFHIESLAFVFRAGLRIEEIPITYRFTNSSLQPAIVWEALRTWTGLWTRELV
ncbi:MAG: glycosyltransferase family 2 protein [Myxococcota bacterium]|nr:glycosyltransferase family 2 protein [Myxococcota bacterium]